MLGAVMFIGITLLFLDFTGTLHHWVGWMPKIQLLEAVLAVNVVVVAALVLLTLVLGRIYCSVICPLGILQDVFGWLGKKVRKNRYSYSKEVRWLRYPVLVLFVAALLAGVGTVVQLLAPYSAFGRIATTLLQPVWKACNNLLAAVAEHVDSYAFYHVDAIVPHIGLVTAIAAVTLVILFVLAWRNGRTYCNTICPVGTVLSLLSRWSWLKIRFDADKCKSCSLCSKNCKASCIDFKTHSVDYSRCVVCGDCIDSCKHGALSYQAHQAHERNPMSPISPMTLKVFLGARSCFRQLWPRRLRWLRKPKRQTVDWPRLRTRWHPTVRHRSFLRERARNKTSSNTARVASCACRSVLTRCCALRATGRT